MPARDERTRTISRRKDIPTVANTGHCIPIYGTPRKNIDPSLTSAVFTLQGVSTRAFNRNDFH